MEMIDPNVLILNTSEVLRRYLRGEFTTKDLQDMGKRE